LDFFSLSSIDGVPIKIDWKFRDGIPGISTARGRSTAPSSSCPNPVTYPFARDLHAEPCFWTRIWDYLCVLTIPHEYPLRNANKKKSQLTLLYSCTKCSQMAKCMHLSRHPDLR